MAIIPESSFPGKIEPASPEYPYGAARNVTTPGDGTGTPLKAALVNDLFGFQQSLLSAAGLTPTGDPDKVGMSQYLQAIFQIYGNATDFFFSTVQDMKDGKTVGGVYVTLNLGYKIALSGVDSRGKNDSIQFFTVVASTSEIDLGNGLYAQPLRLQTERLRVGNATAPSGTWERDAVMVSRALIGLTDCHAFTDYTVISGVTDGGTYGAFDVKTAVEGTHLQDHVYSFQDRIQSSVDNLAKTTGLYSRPELNAGNIGTRKAIDVFDPVGGGSLSQNYGLFVQELKFGNSINQAIRTQGQTFHSLGGNVAIGYVDSAVNVGPDSAIQLKMGGVGLKGAATYSQYLNPTLQPENVTSYYGIQTLPTLSDGTSIGTVSTLRVSDATLSGSASIAEQYGAIFNDMTSADNKNVAVLSLISDGVGKKNIAVGGTAPNSYAGNSYFGGNTNSVPTAKAHCGPGSATAGTAGLKLTQGTLMTTPENGAFEFDGTNLYFTAGGVRKIVALS